MANEKDYLGQDGKEQSVRHTFSKYEYDLYHEDDDIVLPVVRVKHINLPGKGDRWKIFENTKLMLTIEGSKLNKKEREFLRSVEGVNFLIKQYKAGDKSFNSLKLSVKKKLKAIT
jgi:hypothetical protein